MTRQFTIKLDDSQGALQYFLTSGKFEKIIDAGWNLKDRIAVGWTTIFVFESGLDGLRSFSATWPYDQIQEP